MAAAPEVAVGVDLVDLAAGPGNRMERILVAEEFHTPAVVDSLRAHMRVDTSFDPAYRTQLAGRRHMASAVVVRIHP